ncbi:acyloxyacyl hydrolase [Heterostelium album PN500]|uniref:Acyloxyacyl hydrolase n=1 Tax=Heterostelium pallidum (strain ATCC 26659 / Pp 5 / PN500) TaxID=670386 RepID=D3BK83_HETP5|nr:acyloxyacyl hydrolase [Heterostelium album PN500]EFA78313.1 acyloxyacyl hydrolase [Heterostelium album PN500]|eukprot:XP_020430438.1 acyloxyacyl hydrolase [Heterostelium album PN500]
MNSSPFIVKDSNKKNARQSANINLKMVGKNKNNNQITVDTHESHSTNKQAQQQSIFAGFDLQLAEGFRGGANGGGSCAACTIILNLVDQYSVIHEKSIEHTMDEICSYLPKEAASICTWLVNTFGDDVIEKFAQYQRADDVCHSMSFCTLPTCRLFNNVTATFTGPYYNRPEVAAFNAIDPWQWIKNLINKFGNGHLPIEDLDGDRYSLDSTFRGYSWRGKDCDDTAKHIYPGAENDPNFPDIDWNCNGIMGSNALDKSWEEVLCGNSGAMGTIVVGDSAGAHFSIPPQWLTAADINSTTYVGMMATLENELDWPERSSYTGWNTNSSAGPVDSIYLRLLERNRCNHRDYQNAGVNGARSGNVANGNIQSISRHQQTDNPVLLFLELIGNDVCSGHHDLDHMTTTEEFEANTLKSLNYLDSVLPMGSHVVFVGLADGRVLWDSLWNRTHPIGATYEQVYDFLNCLELSPCWGWMNPNETIRDATSARAAELSAMYNVIISNYTFTHFDMQYYDFPFPAINAEWIAQGGQTWQLIEPVDGFHPNQMANFLITGVLWNQLMTDHPDWLGQVNPYNQLIQSQFGDQNGYTS